jgi:pimeloyl-ACP methyl ester carboxylesterase
MIGAMSGEFLLVHGMSHGGWAWDPPRARLERAGHRVVAPALPGHGRTYVRCLRDVAVPPARAAVYAARLGVTPIDLDCAHSPMPSAPDALARILTSVHRPVAPVAAAHTATARAT